MSRSDTMAIRAAQYAAAKHEGQCRKYDGGPYIAHPLRVAGLVSLFPAADDQLVAAAWLHDTIEDCGVTYGDLCDEFNVWIAYVVQELTNPSKRHPNLPRAERKAMDRDAIAVAGVAARSIKLVDRLDNLRSLPLPAPSSSDFGYYRKYLAETEALVDAICDAGVDERYLMATNAAAIRERSATMLASL